MVAHPLNGVVYAMFLFIDGKSDAQLQQARNHWKVWQELGNTRLAITSRMRKGMG